ncbi:hypothetical protein [Snuella sedimenti]|uniref:Glycosyl hydrolase 109 C-terminal domain-containing protein n=1 Tax=Snuella sedimenti TaxID=2798802 RepID=A0A8J7IF35_9FLAO|nr:hypothetical protein [Snuella sedimenti]MBJ6367322.1 hypothetical protein [Snuella sedimenti]
MNRKTAITGTRTTLPPRMNLWKSKNNSNKLRLGTIGVGVGVNGTNHLNNLLKRDNIMVSEICNMDRSRVEISPNKEKEKPKVFEKLSHFRYGYQHDLRSVKFNNGKQAYCGGVEFGEKGISEAAWSTLTPLSELSRKRKRTTGNHKILLEGTGSKKTIQLDKKFLLKQNNQLKTI